MSASVDRLIVELDRAVKSLGPPAPAHRPFPGSQGQEEAAVADGMSAAERRHAAALMRVNHVGEVCAQALYRAQAAATDSPALRTLFDEAAREEADHLAWTAQRLEELGSRPSLLNPLWFLGAYAAGLIAGRAGDAVSLGFVVETERQVEHHLEGHLNRLPEADTRSRAVVRQMREDEIRHGDAAENEGAARMPWPARLAMQMAAKVMTSTAYWL